MKRLHVAIIFISTIITFLAFSPTTTHASTEIFDGNISTDMTWSQSYSPYIIYSNIFISSGATLTIDPGVVVKFDYGTSMYVEGDLQVSGTKDIPVYFTSIADDTIGGDTNLDNNLSTPQKGDWVGVVFDKLSVKSNLNNFFDYYSNNGITFLGSTIIVNDVFLDNKLSFFNSSVGSLNNITALGLNLYSGSNVTISKSDLENSSGTVLSVNKGLLTIDHSYIKNNAGWGYALGVFNNAHVVADYDTFSNDNYADNINVFGSGSSLDINNSTIEGIANGIISYDGNTNLENTNVHCFDNGIAVYGNGVVTINHSKIQNAKNYGVVSYGGDPNFSHILIRNSEIFGNGTGVGSYQSLVVANSNSIHDNTNGAFVLDDSLGSLDFTGNYWGHYTGPYHSSLNIFGQGNSITDNINYYPYSHFDMLHPGVSNVLFIPGFQGSRLYRKNILGFEDKLWEPNANSDVLDLTLTDNLESRDDIYSRDIIEQMNVFGVDLLKVYDSFIKDLINLKDLKIISDWQYLAYDWRLSPFEVVDNGYNDRGNIFYFHPLDTQQPEIYKKFAQLLDSSKSGKVTIITHSNGGLVAKAFMAKLEQDKFDGTNTYIDDIDKVIMVAAPQIGTPKAVAGLLHGYDQSIKSGLILKQSIARLFGINLPGAYSLLPSAAYFDKVSNPIIKFDPNLKSIANFYLETYHNEIKDNTNFNGFLSARLDQRLNPQDKDLNSPAILKSAILEQTIKEHGIIDNLVLPNTIKLYQIAGWGLPTLKSLRYYTQIDCLRIIANHKCTNVKSLAVDPEFVDDGDKTVVTPSAVFMNTPRTYYIDFRAHNDFYHIKEENSLDHTSIFELTILRDFIKHILFDQDNTSQFITTSKPHSRPNMVLKLHTVNLGQGLSVKDSLGNITGISLPIAQSLLPLNTVAVQQNIPGSTYVSLGSNQYIVVPQDGSYQVSISSTNYVGGSGVVTDTGGVDFGNTQLDLSTTTIDTSTPTPSIGFVDVPITSNTEANTSINNGVVGNLAVDTNGTGIIDTTITPQEIITPIEIITNSVPVPVIRSGVGGHPFINTQAQQNIETTKDLITQIPIIENEEIKKDSTKSYKVNNTKHSLKELISKPEEVLIDSGVNPDFILLYITIILVFGILKYTHNKK